MNNQLDWRYWKATELVKEFHSPYTGKTYPPGTPVSVPTGIKHENREISIGSPSAPALFLNQAHEAHQEALKIYPFLLSKWPPQIDKEPTVIVFDYLELIMASVIFSYTSLESFANELIPDNFQYKERRKTGLVAVRDKDWVERNTSLTTKIGELLPSERGVSSPKGTVIWENFVTLQRLRDRIIHMKTIDRETAKNDNFSPESIWSDLTLPTVIDFPSSTKSVMEHFYINGLPYWLTNCPF